MRANSSLSLVLLLCGLCAVRSDGAVPPERLYDALSEQVVLVETFDEWHRPLMQGSAVVLGASPCTNASPSIDATCRKANSEGTDLLSNFHVIAFANRIVIQTKSGDRLLAAIVFCDSDRDVAVLRTARRLRSKPVTVAEPGKVGQRVYALGAPKGLGWTFSEGIISAVRQEGSNRLIQTTAAISSGSSGGGLFGEDGKLIGITTLQIREGQNLNFARPVALPEIRELAEARQASCVQAADVDHDEWVVGTIKRTADIEQSWRKSHPRWVKWMKLDPDERYSALLYDPDDQGNTTPRPHVWLTFWASSAVRDATSIMRNYYEARRYLDFPLDIKGLLATIELEERGAEKVRSSGMDFAGIQTNLREVESRKELLIRSIREEHRNRWEVQEFEFWRQFDKGDTRSARQVLQKFAESLPDRLKDESPPGFVLDDDPPPPPGFLLDGLKSVDDQQLTDEFGGIAVGDDASTNRLSRGERELSGRVAFFLGSMEIRKFDLSSFKEVLRKKGWLR